MVVRTSTHGPFWGCRRYPACSGTVRIARARFAAYLLARDHRPNPLGLDLADLARERAKATLVNPVPPPFVIAKKIPEEE